MKADATAARPARYYTLGPQVRAFIKATCRHTKGPFAGQPVDLGEHAYQREFVDELFLVDAATDEMVYSSALWGLPTKSGKSTSAAALCIDGMANPLWKDAEAEVYAAANSRRQAGVVGDQVASMARTSPLADRFDVQAHLIKGPRGSLFRALAAEAGTVHGVNPSRTIYDELGSSSNDQLLATLEKSTGARRNPLTLNITHWGVERFGPLGQIYDRALESPDVDVRFTPGVESVIWARDRANGFLMAWHGVLDEHRDRIDDPDIWLASNPAPWINERFLRRQLGKASMREADFVRYHLNGAVLEANTWLDPGVWQSLKAPGLVLPGDEPAYIAVDASVKYDLSAIIVDVPERVAHGDGERYRHRLKAHVFEPGPGGGMLQRLENALRDLARRYDVRAVAFDPWRFHRSAEELASEGLPMIEFPQSHERMVPASQQFFELANDGLLAHDGDRQFAEHVVNAVVRETARGWRIDKSKATRKIDAAIAAVMAVNVAEDMLAVDTGPGPRFSVID